LAVLKNTFATAVLKGLGAVCTMAVIFIAGRVASAGELGSYFYFFSIVIVLSCLMRFGLDICIVQSNACEKNISVAYSVGLLFSTALAITSCMLVFLLKFIGIEFDDVWILVLVILSAYFLSLIDLICALDWSRQKHIKSSFLKFAMYPVLNLLVYWVFVIVGVSQSGVILLLSALAASLLIVCVIVFFVVDGSLRYLVMINLDEINKTVKGSSAIFVENILTIVAGNLPVFFLGAIVSSEANAIYGVSRRLSNIMGFLSTSAVRVITPIFASNADYGARKEILSKKRQMENVLSVIMLVAVFLSIIYGQAALNFFGVDGPGWLLSLLLAAHLFSMRIATNTAFFQVVNKPLLGMSVAILNCIMSIIFLWLLSVYAGIYGVAFAILIVSALLACISNVMIVRVYKA
jgi:O-antigen/teichoic acid export membrane protein